MSRTPTKLLWLEVVVLLLLVGSMVGTALSGVSGMLGTTVPWIVSVAALVLLAAAGLELWRRRSEMGG